MGLKSQPNPTLVPRRQYAHSVGSGSVHIFSGKAHITSICVRIGNKPDVSFRACRFDARVFLLPERRRWLPSCHLCATFPSSNNARHVPDPLLAPFPKASPGDTSLEPLLNTHSLQSVLGVHFSTEGVSVFTVLSCRTCLYVSVILSLSSPSDAQTNEW